LALIKEIYKDSLPFFLISAFLHIALKCLLELVRNEFFELFPIFFINQSIMEHSQGLVDPKTIDSKLRIAIELIKDINTLNDFADISHIEHVV
jgi:hypothetical protein